MIVIGGLCAAGALISLLFVSDKPGAAPRIGGPRPRLRPARPEAKERDEPRRTDRRRDRRHRRHRARDGAARPRRGRRRSSSRPATPDRLSEVGRELGAKTAAFDVTDFDRLQRFFEELPGPVDHVLVTGPGPYYALLEDFDFDEARRDIEAHLLLPMQVAKLAGRTGAAARCCSWAAPAAAAPAPGLSLIGALTAAMPALTKNLALEVAPIRVNLIAAGFVDTPLSASLLGDQLEARREQLRDTLPIRRVVGPG